MNLRERRRFGIRYVVLVVVTGKTFLGRFHSSGNWVKWKAGIMGGLSATEAAQSDMGDEEVKRVIRLRSRVEVHETLSPVRCSKGKKQTTTTAVRARLPSPPPKSRELVGRLRSTVGTVIYPDDLHPP